MTGILLDSGDIAILGGNMILGPTSTPPPPVQNAPIKFIPGDYIQSDGKNADASLAQFQTEMNLIANDTTKTFIGYAPLYTWDFFENNTQGVYDFSKLDGVINFFVNAMALKGRFGYIGISVACFAVNLITVAQLSTTRPGGVPRYIQNSSTFGPGPPPSPYFGWWGQNYNGSAFVFSRANTCNANVQTAFNNMWIAMANHQITMTAGQFSGQTFTLDQCPHVAYVTDYGPDDIAMLQNPPNTTPTNWSPSAFYTQWYRQMPAMSSAWTHTFTLMTPGYGASNPSNEATVLANMYNNRMGISATDTFADLTQLSYSQQQTLGNSYNGNTLVTGGGTDYRPLCLIAPTTEAPDYSRSTGTYASFSIPLVRGGIADLYKLFQAQYRIWTICGQNAVIPGDFNNFIQPGVKGAQNDGNTAVTLLPPQYMIAPQGLQATAITNTSVTLQWNQITGSGTGITYTVYINGTVAVGGLNAANPIATIGGLNPLTTYAFTVAIANAYGTGPQSAPLSVETT